LVFFLYNSESFKSIFIDRTRHCVSTQFTLSFRNCIVCVIRGSQTKLILEIQLQNVLYFFSVLCFLLRWILQSHDPTIVWKFGSFTDASQGHHYICYCCKASCENTITKIKTNDLYSQMTRNTFSWQATYYFFQDQQSDQRNHKEFAKNLSAIVWQKTPLFLVFFFLTSLICRTFILTLYLYKKWWIILKNIY
jgi:hypothetical protein